MTMMTMITPITTPAVFDDSAAINTIDEQINLEAPAKIGQKAVN